MLFSEKARGGDDPLRSHLGADKHLWIVNHHARIPSKDGKEGGSARHLRLAGKLKDYGWTTSLIVASTKHPTGTQGLSGWRMRKLSEEEGIHTLWVRTNSYRNLPMRFVGMVLFAANLLRPYITRGLQKPDAILGSTVHPLAAWAAFRLSRRVRVPFIYEIRDVWPETLHDVGNISSKHPISKLISRIDIMLIKNSALVVSPLPYVNRHLTEVGFPDKPFLWISNGTEMVISTGQEEGSTRGPFTFMYLGAHGAANGIDDLLRAFDLASERCPDVKMKFRLVGDGSLKPELEILAASLKNGDQVHFEKRIPEMDALERAREADCLVVNVPNRPVYRFGVSPNKTYMYMSASRPIISASSAPNDPVGESQSGINVPGGDVEAIAEAMVRMARTPVALRAEMGMRGRLNVRDNYTFSVLARRLADGLDQVLASN